MLFTVHIQHMPRQKKSNIPSQLFVLINWSFADGGYRLGRAPKLPEMCSLLSLTCIQNKTQRFVLQNWFCGQCHFGSKLLIYRGGWWTSTPLASKITEDIFFPPSLHLINSRSNISIFVCCHDIIPKTLSRSVLQISHIFSRVWIFTFTGTRLKHLDILHFYVVHVILQLPNCMFNSLKIKPVPLLSKCRCRHQHLFSSLVFLITVWFEKEQNKLIHSESVLSNSTCE